MTAYGRYQTVVEACKRPKTPLQHHQNQANPEPWRQGANICHDPLDPTAAMLHSGSSWLGKRFLLYRLFGALSLFQHISNLARRFPDGGMISAQCLQLQCPYENRAVPIGCGKDTGLLYLGAECQVLIFLLSLHQPPKLSLRR
ncbi:hypothetical protein PVE_P0005 (plasmid) [Pseudomonas veronii 1YdBTEX2]|uniref:Uncharacterized protein n=1 Tax=Pseudomonas veronii 1YdBTEX2 TaxID=1295141 RepID=A0A1D3K9R8_PSEVE|nr:hypothetical protein PVE_P0005 [Pseudomonas veronii 1YdBTEX2]